MPTCTCRVRSHLSEVEDVGRGRGRSRRGRGAARLHRKRLGRLLRRARIPAERAGGGGDLALRLADAELGDRTLDGRLATNNE